MQIKNSQTRHMQFYFYREVKKGESKLEYVHIPAGATVELPDEIYKALLASKTEVPVVEEVVTKIEGDTKVEMDRKPVEVKDYYETGETRVVNLFSESIKAGELIVVSRPSVTMKEVEEVLTANGVVFANMSEDAKLALYEKLV